MTDPRMIQAFAIGFLVNPMLWIAIHHLAYLQTMTDLSPTSQAPTDADLEPALLEQRYFAPKEPTTEDKKPLSLVCNCHFKGMPPNPHQSWQDYFTHCAATGIISNLRIEAIQPTPSVNDTLLDAADD